MKFSTFLSTAALVAACATTLPSQVAAGDLQVMGKAVKGTNQLLRRHSPRRLQAHGQIAHDLDPSRRAEAATLDQDVILPRQKKLKHKRACKTKKSNKGHSSGSRDSEESDSPSQSPHSHPSGGNKGTNHGSGHGSHHHGGNSTNTGGSSGGSSGGSCFPALGFNMPSKVPSSLDGWWCDPNDEVAFLGFSYSVSGE